MYQTLNQKNPLTLDEQNFAAVHYGTVFSFLKSRKLDPEEYHGIVIERYLLAVRSYLTKANLQQYSFYTVAKWAMLSALSNYWRKLRREQQYRSCVPLDILSDLETDWKDGCIEHIEALETLSQITHPMTSQQKSTILLVSAGYTHKEIGRAEGITESGINSRIYRIRHSHVIQKAKSA